MYPTDLSNTQWPHLETAIEWIRDGKIRHWKSIKKQILTLGDFQLHRQVSKLSINEYL